jgi:hypothetical protein
LSGVGHLSPSTRFRQQMIGDDGTVGHLFARGITSTGLEAGRREEEHRSNRAIVKRWGIAFRIVEEKLKRNVCPCLDVTGRKYQGRGERWAYVAEHGGRRTAEGGKPRSRYRKTPLIQFD